MWPGSLASAYPNEVNRLISGVARLVHRVEFQCRIAPANFTVGGLAGFCAVTVPDSPLTAFNVNIQLDWQGACGCLPTARAARRSAVRQVCRFPVALRPRCWGNTDGTDSAVRRHDDLRWRLHQTG